MADWDLDNPSDDAVVSQYPANARAFRSLFSQRFPNVSGEMVHTHTRLNRAGNTVVPGTRVLFQQTTPPTGWVKITSDVNNRALRLVSGSVGSGGTNAFTTAFNSSRSTSATGLTTGSAGSHNHGGTNNHTLTVAQLPSHSHGQRTSQGTSANAPAAWHYGAQDEFGTSRWTNPGSQNTINDQGQVTTDSTGSGQGHSHSISNDGSHTHNISSHTHTLNLNVQYLDVVLAEADSD
jgi:hypothetical protein